MHNHRNPIHTYQKKTVSPLNLLNKGVNLQQLKRDVVFVLAQDRVSHDRAFFEWEYFFKIELSNLLYSGCGAVR